MSTPPSRQGDRRLLFPSLLLVAALGVTACSGGEARRPARTIIVYGFSILGETMNTGIFPAFAEKWQREKGEQVQFLGAFASSGTITNQMLFGAPADIALLSHELDALRLRGAGVVRTDWRALPHRGVVNRTPFIIVTREGNPHRIRDYSDLAREGIEIAHPDPLTSGGALWSILAEYGSVVVRGGTAEAAERQLVGIWANVRYQAASARAVRTQFETGFGDALVTYEQETLSKPIRGGVAVYPPATILSEHIAVLVDRNVDASERDLARAFLGFLWSRQGQEIFVRHGFRSVDDSLNRSHKAFPALQHPFTVADLGGWTAARDAIIETIWKQRVLPEVQR